MEKKDGNNYDLKKDSKGATSSYNDDDMMMIILAEQVYKWFSASALSISHNVCFHFWWPQCLKRR